MQIKVVNIGLSALLTVPLVMPQMSEAWSYVASVAFFLVVVSNCNFKFDRNKILFFLFTIAYIFFSWLIHYSHFSLNYAKILVSALILFLISQAVPSKTLLQNLMITIAVVISVVLLLQLINKELFSVYQVHANHMLHASRYSSVFYYASDLGVAAVLLLLASAQLEYSRNTIILLGCLATLVAFLSQSKLGIMSLIFYFGFTSKKLGIKVFFVFLFLGLFYQVMFEYLIDHFDYLGHFWVIKNSYLVENKRFMEIYFVLSNWDQFLFGDENLFLIYDKTTAESSWVGYTLKAGIVYSTSFLVVALWMLKNANYSTSVVLIFAFNFVFGAPLDRPKLLVVTFLLFLAVRYRVRGDADAKNL